MPESHAPVRQPGVIERIEDAIPIGVQDNNRLGIARHGINRAKFELGGPALSGDLQFALEAAETSLDIEPGDIAIGLGIGAKDQDSVSQPDR